MDSIDERVSSPFQTVVDIEETLRHVRSFTVTEVSSKELRARTLSAAINKLTVDEDRVEGFLQGIEDHLFGGACTSTEMDQTFNHKRALVAIINLVVETNS